MITKQAELKKQAYSSDLKSRALSILIYLIDRSNKELTCFPAIPTMAEQLHISQSTVKRALHELVDAGFIQKDSRFRENNRGQSSNLYTLVFKAEASAPVSEQDNNLTQEDYIEPAKQTAAANSNLSKTAEHITFADIAPKQ
ncbi:MAG: helix-turn-helix domain-containing protein, partial [Clostridia bacterium]